VRERGELGLKITERGMAMKWTAPAWVMHGMVMSPAAEIDAHGLGDAVLAAPPCIERWRCRFVVDAGKKGEVRRRYCKQRRQLEAELLQDTAGQSFEEHGLEGAAAV
jgi:hypothetical protein